MTIVMLVMHWVLRRSTPEELPPTQIVRKASEISGAGIEDEEPWFGATQILSHFGFGAVAGTGSLFLPSGVIRRARLAGPVYGLLVWLANYLGLLPALGLLPPATEQPSQRNLIMIVAHLTWGVVLGFVSHRLLSDTNPRNSSRDASSSPGSRILKWLFLRSKAVASQPVPDVRPHFAESRSKVL